MRRHAGVLWDHFTKSLTPLEEARVELIPPGGDWRSLPNEEKMLKDGTLAEKLLFPVCMKSSNQKKTLIPRFMEYSGDRNNNYAGCYGRVKKDGVFPTVITDPRPDGLQGRVLHSDQDRVCSVREFARAQGFPDHYRFCGTFVEKYRQVWLSSTLIIQMKIHEYFFLKLLSK